MNDRTSISVTFVAFLLLFVMVGRLAALRKQNTTTDYLLASRNVNPWLTGLSAMATTQSGFMFTGMVGFSYKLGLASIWLIVGATVGQHISWWLVGKRLRKISAQRDVETFSSFLDEKSGGKIAAVSGIITIAFLGAYAAAQLVAGSKTLNVIFGWNYYFGIVLGALIVVIYCFSGGIRASIWTDAVQGCVMVGSLLLLSVVAVVSCGGAIALSQKLSEIDPALVSLNPPSLAWGVLPFAIGWLANNLGVVGQPHIMVRAMAIDSEDNMDLANNVRSIFFVVNFLAAMAIGLTGRVLMPEFMSGGDPELALPYLALELLPVGLVGVMLAGLFAGTISTADSQILSCSATLGRDLFGATANSYTLAKLWTLLVTMLVVAIAILAPDNVFALIIFCWSALASGLGPLLVLRVWQKPVTAPVAIAMMLVGIGTALTWIELKLSDGVNEALPGMAAGMAVYLIAQIFTATRQEDRAIASESVTVTKDNQCSQPYD